jgi:hypothetical protein
MNASTTAKTRYEDWQDRRQFLESQGGTNPRRVLHVRVLNYLIRRYRDSAIAHLPARFALQRDLQWNDRRITVHHHLGRGKVAGVQTRDEAEQRIADLVQRMVSDERIEREDFRPTELPNPPHPPFRITPPGWRIRLGWNVDSQIQKALANYPLLPTRILEHLVSRLTDVTHEDTDALVLFLQCENRNMIQCTVRAWRDRVAKGESTGVITETLETRIGHPDNRPSAAELIRERLADDNAQVRIAASRLIARIGDLDDIGLLSDLLALPVSSDEDPHERDALTAAMRVIAKRGLS